MLFNKEYEFKGKHATYCRFLKEKIHLFKTFREAYATCALVGFINDRRADRDTAKQDDKVQPASILPGEMAQKRLDLAFIYRLMMLIIPIENGTEKDYQDRAFRYDADEGNYSVELQECMKIFNSYVLGGIEILYDVFKDCKDTKDVVNTLNDYLFEFYEDTGIIDVTEE